MDERQATLLLSVENSNPFSIASEILKAAGVEGFRHRVLFYGKKLGSFIRYLASSPWRHRFDARSLADLVVKLSFKPTSNLGEVARHWINLAMGSPIT